jgi:hypothetical protein
VQRDGAAGSGAEELDLPLSRRCRRVAQRDEVACAKRVSACGQDRKVR